MRRKVKEPGPYCFESDEDGHFYVIPIARMKAWSEWLRSEDADDGVEPIWAHCVGGNPSLISFPDYGHQASGER